MPEGLSAAEVGKEIAQHKQHAAPHEGDDRDRWLSIVEAVLLSLVAVLAAYSGYAAAKWSTESSVTLAKASAERTKASRAALEGIVTRTLDSASFNAWFTAYTAGDANAQRLAVRRMRPGYRPAFNAWLATDPVHNPNAPPGPTYMPQYKLPAQVQANVLDRRATAKFDEGTRGGEISDNYIRITVFLAAVLFLVGIGSTFKIHTIRYALVTFGLALLVLAIVLILNQPGPPG